VDRVHGTVDRRRGQVHGGPSDGVDTRHGGVLPAHGASCATGLQSSPARAREEEGDEAESMRGSSELER
jgi:hypothetical protein